MSDFDDVFGEEEDEGITKSEKPVTYVGFVWDHSGSMGDSTELARTNFNEQLTTLKKDSDKIDYRVTIIEFDDKIKEVAVNKPIDEVQKMKDYWVGGMTSLYDAVGRCVSKINSQMENDPVYGSVDEPEDKAALIIVMTDGAENCSTDYNNETIRNLIQKMNAKDDWSFVFMGAGIDERQAREMGFGAANTMTFAKGDKGYNMSNIVQADSLSTYSRDRIQGMTKSAAFYSNSSGDKPDNVKDESQTAEDKGV